MERHDRFGTVMVHQAYANRQIATLLLPIAFGQQA
jgi:hypothetical protein